MRMFCEKMGVGVAAVCFALPALAQTAQIGGMPSALFSDLANFGSVNGGMLLGGKGVLELLPSDIKGLNLTDLDVSTYLERSGELPAQMRRDLRDFVAAAAVLPGAQVFGEIEPPADSASVAEALLKRFHNNAFVRIEVLPFGFRDNEGGLVNGLYRITRDDGTSLIVTTLTGPNGEPIIIRSGGQRSIVGVSFGGNPEIINVPSGQAQPCVPTTRGDLQKSCYDQVVKVSWANGGISEAGSGVFIHPEYMLTAAHVVSFSASDIARSRNIFVYQYRNRVKRRFRVRNVEIIPDTDLAILRLVTLIESQNRVMVSPILDGMLAQETTTFSVAGYGILRSGLSVNEVRWGLFNALQFSRDQEIFGGMPIVIDSIGRVSRGCKSDSAAPAFAFIAAPGLPLLAFSLVEIRMRAGTAQRPHAFST